MESRDNIWNHHENCIQISTNMPSFGSLIREIPVKITEIGESKNTFDQKKTTMPAFTVLKYAVKENKLTLSNLFWVAGACIIS